ncbi:MAG: hypothetical protein U0229_06255 [Anaeromyxobacter sp.]
MDEPFPGRVYKIRCGRCGTLLTVQAPVPWEAPGSLELPLEVAPPEVAPDRGPAPAPAVRAAPPPLPAPPPAPGPPVPPDYGTEEIPVDLGLSDELPLLQRKHRRRERRMTIGISAAAAAGLVLIVGLMLRAAAGAGTGSGTGTGAGTGSGSAAATASAAAAPAPVPAPAQYPAYPMPTGPVAKPAPAAVAAVPPATPKPAGADRPPRAASRPAARPPPAPAPPAHSPAPTSARVAFEGQRGRPAAPAAPAVDPGLAASTLLRKQDAPVRTGLPDPTELSRVLDGRRAALDACFDYAATSAGGAAWQGRAAQLVVRVAGTGAATARVDDPALEPTEIAACLRRTIARTPFPAFAGEPVELRAQVGLPRE